MLLVLRQTWRRLRLLSPLENDVMSDSLTIPSPDGTGEFTLYIAGPAQEPRAALLVIQEIYGVNADIRCKCDLLAQQGYLANGR